MFIKRTGLSLFILLFCHQGLAQSLEVVAHYPASAFVINRLLPFVVGGDENLRVVRVDAEPFGSCSTLSDPYYPTIFHLYCRQPGSIDLAIHVIDGMGRDRTLPLENISVAIQRTPRDEFDSAIREAAAGEP